MSCCQVKIWGHYQFSTRINWMLGLRIWLGQDADPLRPTIEAVTQKIALKGQLHDDDHKLVDSLQIAALDFRVSHAMTSKHAVMLQVSQLPTVAIIT